MATSRDIILLPDKRLRQRSKRVGIIDKTVSRVIKDMQSATLHWEDNRNHEVGVALAAVQLGHLLRIVVVRQDFQDKKNRKFEVFVNPVITKLGGDIIEDYEGCLSIKDIYGKVPRHSKVKIKALGIDGKEFRVTAEGFLARIFQHEIDHTNGTVFIDHIKDNSEAFFRLEEDGKLKPLNYEKDIKNNHILW